MNCPPRATGIGGGISRFSLLTIVVRGWGKHRTPHPLFFYAYGKLRHLQ
nr:MAG TPA: hypothetical protein [Crassvirales sp.]